MQKIKRNYEHSEYPSVTEVLGILKSRGLEEWFKRTPYEQIISESKKSKEIGTTLHETIQSYIETGTASIDTKYPEEVTNALKSFMLFKKEHPELKLKRSEIQLTSHKYKFNGTMDVMADLYTENKCQKPLMLAGDWKSGKCKDEEKPKIWDEMKDQVSTYVHLINEVEALGVDTAFIVVLAKDKVAYNFEIITKKEIDARFKNVFLPALKICYFRKKK